MKKFMLAVAFAALAAAPWVDAQSASPSGSAAQIVNRAADAMGGKARIMAVRTLTITGTGSTWTAGDVGVSPAAEPDRTRITDYERVIDLVNGRMRFTQRGVLQYPFALAVTNQVDQRLDGDLAFGPAPAGAAGGGAAAGGPDQGNPLALVRANAAAAHQRRLDYLSNPLTAVRAALAPSAKLSVHNPAAVAGDRIVDVTGPQGEDFSLAVDAAGLPAWISWKIADPNLGDVTQQALFEEYTDVNGIKLPSRLETMTERWKTSDLKVTCNYTVSSTRDDIVADLAAPISLKNAPAPQGPAGGGGGDGQGGQMMVTAERVAKGIWYMGGTGEHSVLFEFADHLVLYETPGGDPRTLAVIRKARETVPSKPLTIAINSHHHFDHAGGFRSAVSEGLTMYAYKDNVEHFKEIAARPHTMNPDALQMNPKPLKIVPVDDMLEMKDAQMDIILYHVHPSAITHSSTELVVWVPRDKILVEADQYDHTWLRYLWGENFIWNVEMLRHLEVSQILPVHGNGPENWKDVVATIRSKPVFFRTDAPDF